MDRWEKWLFSEGDAPRSKLFASYGWSCYGLEHSADVGWAYPLAGE